MQLGEHLGDVDPRVRAVIETVAAVSLEVAAAFPDYQGSTGTVNVQDEEQLELDAHADSLFCSALTNLEGVAKVVSEEQELALDGPTPAGVSVLMDPLDGSSLIDVNFAVGSIFGIQSGPDPLAPGNQLAAAFYILYGPMTQLIYATRDGVHEFVHQGGQWRLLAENLKIPSAKLYAPGGLRKDWSDAHRAYIEELESRGYKLRFSGAFVADVHQILHKGGLFTYPATVDRPSGKLRLLFEGNPMAFITTVAGGGSCDGEHSLLDLQPTQIHQRVPIYIGGASEIALARKHLSS